jgi:NADH-quinone oxidoreductase subunit C
MLDNENKLTEQITKTFHSAKVEIKREKRVVVQLRSDLIPPFLSYAKEYLEFKHLSHISCVDWIEDNELELVFILWNYESQLQIISKTRIQRENAQFVSLKKFWNQAETYEREIHEMYGVFFEGNDRLGEFILEDWEDKPPMLRDFNTRKYSKETYYNRPGREDAQSVRETITKHSGEEVPDFAKDYTIRNIEE